MSEPKPVLLLDPTVRQEPRESSQRAPRLASLDGATIGLLANGKTHGMAILDHVLANLEKDYAVADTVRVEKSDASMPVPEGDLAMMAERCQAVIAAIGD